MLCIMWQSCSTQFIIYSFMQEFLVQVQEVVLNRAFLAHKKWSYSVTQQLYIFIIKKKNTSLNIMNHLTLTHFNYTLVHTFSKKGDKKCVFVIKSVLHPHSSSVPDMECCELHPLVERLHSGSAGHHRAAHPGGLGAGGLPAHRHRRHCGKESSRQLPGAVPHSKHRPADPYAAVVQTHGRTHGHRRLPAFQVRRLDVWGRVLQSKGEFKTTSPYS